MKSKLNQDRKEDYNYISNLINKDREYLFWLLGLEIQSDEKRINDSEKSRLIKIAKVWYEDKFNELKEKICKEEILRNLNSDKAKLYLAILDCISPLLINVSPFTVTAILVKNGIKTLCEE